MSSRALALLLVCGLATPRAADGPIENADQRRQTIEGDLARQIETKGEQATEPFWVAYTVPMTGGDPLCCGDPRRGWRVTTCDLESTEVSSYRSLDDGARAGSSNLLVLLRIDDGRIDAVRSYTEDCVLDAGGRVVYRFLGVSPGESIELLASLVDGEEGGKPSRRAEQAVSAIAHHADATADRVLARWTRPPAGEELRSHVAFWLGSARGSEGVRLLRRMLRDDPGPDVREQVVFALSLGDDPGTVALLIDIARNDRSSKIRGTALFWLAQKAGERAVATLRQAIADDPDADVREAAVFGVSQLPANDGVPILIDLARKNRDREVREQAMFWLGQSGDPRALELFEEILSD